MGADGGKCPETVSESHGGILFQMQLYPIKMKNWGVKYAVIDMVMPHFASEIRKKFFERGGITNGKIELPVRQLLLCTLHRSLHSTVRCCVWTVNKLR